LLVRQENNQVAAAVAQVAPVVKVRDLFLRSSAAAPRLRVGLITPTGALHAPGAQVIAALREANFIDLIASIKFVRPAAQLDVSESFLLRLYRQWDLPHASAALQPSEPGPLLDELPAFHVEVNAAGEACLPSEEERAALTRCRFDVLLVLGSVVVNSWLEGLARFGIWSNDLGDPLFGDRLHRQFWNTSRQSAPLPISLQALLPDGTGPITLASAQLPLISSVSTTRNLTGIAAVAQDLMLSKLWQLHQMGWEYLRSQARSVEPPPASEASPSNRQILQWLVPKMVRQIRHRIRVRNTLESWCVGLRSASSAQGLDAALCVEAIDWMDIPPGRYHADPFLISQSGETYLFVEDFDIAANIGSIAYLPVTGGTVSGPARTVLSRPYHLSYPQVFDCDGETFMIPESGANNSVELYRAVSFPNRWELVKVLFRGPAYDVTLLRDGGRFWFFVSLVDIACPQRVELLLFSSDSLNGQWSLHPASPISRDIRTARCGGAPFLDRGSWIRPAQDGSTTYGGALRYQRILRLDPQHYLEAPAGCITADMLPGMTGVHTYNRCGDVEVFDAKRRRSMHAAAD
jgi:hypothetical protein